MRALPAAAAPARGTAAATGSRPTPTALGYEPLPSVGVSRDAEEAVDAAAAAANALPRLVVAWRYAQRGKQRGGGDLVSVSAESSFALAREPTATVAGGSVAGGSVAGGGAAGGLRIASHTLGGLELNGRPALPEVPHTLSPPSLPLPHPSPPLPTSPNPSPPLSTPRLPSPCLASPPSPSPPLIIPSPHTPHTPRRRSYCVGCSLPPEDPMYCSASSNPNPNPDPSPKPLAPSP